MLELMLRTVLVGVFATAAALLFERAFAHLRLGTRFAWTFALLATLVLPFVPQLITTNRVPDVVPVIAAPAIVVSATSTIESRFSINPIVAAWLGLSGAVLLAYIFAYVRLARARRRWVPAQVAQQNVFMSEQFGPAVFGFIAPRIVVPRWVGDTAREEQELIVLHEREHIRARDQLQLLLAIVATVLMPWNPLIWVHARRLRFAIEADCDQRVLAAAPDRARYASLLVNVGAKQMGLRLTPALAEHRNGLERRLHMLASKLIQNRWKAAGMMVMGAVLTVVACESRLPQEAAQEPEQAKVVERLRREAPKVLDKGESSLTLDERSATIMTEAYPALLRDAGISGTVSLRVHVTDRGEVKDVEVSRSSGHDALDQAAVRMARRFAWGNPGKTRDYWAETSITFGKNLDAMKVELRPSLKEELRSLPRKVDPNDEPHFTPYTQMPELRNREVVGAALVKSYPPLLRDAGIGGRVLTWVLIDENGHVVTTKVKESSGRRELDEAALQVAKEMEFKPAQNNGAPVSVWISLPIVFRDE